MARSSTTFRPGMPSPNPGGRRRDISSVRELARQYTEDAINVLASILFDQNEKGSVKVAAANVLLERGWGKPEQAMSITQVDVPVEKMTTAQLYALINAPDTPLERNHYLIKGETMSDNKT